MHIPDGYLSPSTCAVLYGAALPFWYGAFARVKWLLNTRLVPLLAVASAFCFVIMMFNIPLPGGTTGHAVGVGAAAIVLGPWASMLALSIALMIQAVFFGDGGITTLGANCFNMAVAGSLVAFLVYRLIAGRAELTSSRRTIAAALAGYAAINASAFLTACELGIQPLVFQRRRWSAAIRSLSVAHRNSSDDDRAPLLRRHCRVGCVGRSGGIPAAFESFTAGKFCVHSG